jgi:hypothetical protein
MDKPVVLDLDKKRHLRLTMKGMIEFEKLTGKSMLRGVTFNELSLEECAALAWACMIHEDKELTYDDVLYMIDLSNINTVLGAVTDCINRSLPQKESTSPLSEKPKGKAPLG